MKQRHDDLLAKHSKEISKEKKNKSIFKNFGVVDTYNHGTTGYRIKEGSNKDKVVGHIKLKGKEISKEKKNKSIFKNFGVVDTYNHGTTGYRIKEGSNKDKVVGHIKLKSKEI